MFLSRISREQLYCHNIYVSPFVFESVCPSVRRANCVTIGLVVLTQPWCVTDGRPRERGFSLSLSLYTSILYRFQNFITS